MGNHTLVNEGIPSSTGYYPSNIFLARFAPDSLVSNHEIKKVDVGYSVYPNPATTEVNFTLPSGVTTADIEVYDPQGRLVRSLLASQGPQIQISTTDFLPGKYFIRLTSGKEVYAGAFDVVK